MFVFVTVCMCVCVYVVRGGLVRIRNSSEKKSTVVKFLSSMYLTLILTTTMFILLGQKKR